MEDKVHIKKFEFSPFQENTYVVYNNHRHCWIIDPGCYFPEEKQELAEFIASSDLKPMALINTHCHLDHVFGNAFVCEQYNLLPQYHRLEQQTMALAPVSANMYGVPGFETSPAPEQFLKVPSVVKLDGLEAELRFCPGHAPGHIVLVFHHEKMVVGGDVLFRESIGRTDLPGGDHQTLLTSIRQQLFTLDDDYVVYSGHGPETTIGYEKKHNPFL